MATSSSFQLKKPLIVYFLALCFILAPITNIALALLSAHVEDWYLPTLWWKLFVKLTLLEQILLIALFISGVSLTIQKKQSWFFAVSVLLVVSIYTMIFATPHPLHQINMKLFGVAVNIPILIIFYYFRYPYLDKRDHILSGYSQRFQVQIHVLIESISQQGTMTNLSRTGCFCEFPDSSTSFALGGFYNLKLNHELVVQVEIMHKRENGFGARFLNLSFRQKRTLYKLIKKFQSQ